MIAKIKLF